MLDQSIPYSQVSVYLPKLIIEKGGFCDERVKVYARGRGKEGRRRTSSAALEEKVVAVAFDEFHLCGMVLRDTGASDLQSEYLVETDVAKKVGSLCTVKGLTGFHKHLGCWLFA